MMQLLSVSTIFTFLCARSLAFVIPRSSSSLPRCSTVTYAGEEGTSYDSLMDKLGAAADAVAPALAPVVEVQPPPPVVTETPIIPEAVIPDEAAISAVASQAADAATSLDMGILPVAAVGVLAVAAAAAVFAGGGGGDSEGEAPAAVAAPTPAAAFPSSSSSSSSSPAASDLSIPYDAAARLAYEKSDKSMAYDAFKTKYEEDAVKDVKSKQKK